MKTMAARLVAGYAIFLLCCLSAGAPIAQAQQTSTRLDTAADGTGAAPPGNTATELRQELEATRARLEALEKQLNALEHQSGSQTVPEAVAATPGVDAVVAQLRKDAREALKRAQQARAEAESERDTVRSDVLAKALDAVADAAKVLEQSVESIDIEDLEQEVRDSMDDPSARSTLEAIRKVSRRLQAQLREEVTALQEAEDRVRRARRQAGTWPDVVGEQETAEGDRVSLLKDSVVEADDEVGDFVVVSGNGTVAGHVDGDAVVLGGDLRLKDGARIDGDAVVVGGKIRASDGAVIKGQRVQVTSSGVLSHLLRDTETEVQATEKEDEDSGLFARIRHALAIYLILVGTGLLSLTFAPTRMRNIAEVLEKKTRKSGLTGFLILIALLPATLLLVVTVVGLLVIPFVYAALFAASFAGLTALIVVLARKFPYRRRGQTAAGSVLWGAALLTLATLIPYLGPWIGLAALALALGAVAVSRAGKESPSDFPF